MQHILLVAVLSLVGSVASQGEVRIFPQPKQLDLARTDVKMVLPDTPAVVYSGKELKPCAELLSSQLERLTDRRATIRDTGTGNIVLAVAEELKFKNGYLLTISPKEVKITGQSTSGVFFGVQSLGWLLRAAGRQLAPGQKVELPCLTIRDWPDVQTRGMMLQWSFGMPSKTMIYDTARALAALKYTFIVPEFGPQLISDRRKNLFTAKSWLTREEFRKYVTFCRAQGLEVVPYLNALAHRERGMPWPNPLGDGLDMGDERNYQALFDVLEEYIEDCPGLRYFHFGMDEANACMKENAKKYKKPAAELLAAHINRLNQFCKKHHIKAVVYHDMLLGGDKEKIYWREGVVNGAETDSYLARKKIDRDVVLDYWNYEAFGRYRTVEEIQKEGFKEVWLTPWGGYADFTMPQNAFIIGAGIMGSTWTEVDYCDIYSSQNAKCETIATRRWVGDAVVTLAQVCWNVKTPVELKFDPSVVFDDLYWDQERYARKEIYTAIPLPKNSDPTARTLAPKILNLLKLNPGPRYLKGVPFVLNPANVLALGNIQDQTKQERDELLARPKPWAVFLNGKKDKQITQINIPRAGDQLILYTREFGLTTGTNGYGREANIRDGQTSYGDEWGVGNMAIPRNGYVLSAHGEGLYGCDAVNGFRAVTIMDADGKEVPLGKRPSAGPQTATVTVNKKAKKLIFLHTTAFETAQYMPFIATVELTFPDGTKDRFDLRYGRDICAYDEASFLYGPKNKWLAASSPGNAPNDGKMIYAYEWINPNPEKNIEKATITLADTGRRIGYILLGVTAVE